MSLHTKCYPPQSEQRYKHNEVVLPRSVTILVRQLSTKALRSRQAEGRSATRRQDESETPPATHQHQRPTPTPERRSAMRRTTSRNQICFALRKDASSSSSSSTIRFKPRNVLDGVSDRFVGDWCLVQTQNLWSPCTNNEHLRLCIGARQRGAGAGAGESAAGCERLGLLLRDQNLPIRKHWPKFGIYRALIERQVQPGRASRALPHSTSINAPSIIQNRLVRSPPNVRKFLSHHCTFAKFLSLDQDSKTIPHF